MNGFSPELESPLGTWRSQDTSPRLGSQDSGSPREDFDGQTDHDAAASRYGSQSDIRLSIMPTMAGSSSGSINGLTSTHHRRLLTELQMGDRLRRGLVTSAPSQGIIHDFAFYLRNNHILLAAFVAHPSHPYPVQRRRLLLLNSLGFAFFVTCLAQSLGSQCGASSDCVHHRRDREQLRAVLGAPLLALLRDFPTTLSVALQLLWDVPGGSMGICHCAKQGPCRKGCGRGMLACLMCHLLGLVYAVLAAILFFAFTQVLNIVDFDDVVMLLLTSKSLAFLYALPVSALIFLLLWRAEKTDQHREAGETSSKGGGVPLV